MNDVYDLGGGLILRRMTEEDRTYLIGNIRNGDRKEVEVVQPLQEVFTDVKEPWSVVLKGDLLGIWAEQSYYYEDYPCSVWGFLSTRNVNKHVKDFVRRSREVVDWLFEHFCDLDVCVMISHNEYHSSHKWFKRILGAECYNTDYDFNGVRHCLWFMQRKEVK